MDNASSGGAVDGTRMDVERKALRRILGPERFAQCFEVYRNARLTGVDTSLVDVACGLFAVSPTRLNEMITLLNLQKAVPSAGVAGRPLQDTPAPQPAVPEAAGQTADPWVGRRAGPYILLQHAASGPIARLYIARHKDAGPQDLVVLKLFPLDILQQIGVPALLFDRMKAARELEHQGLVRVFDVGMTKRRPAAWCAMEHVRGVSLVGGLAKLEQKGLVGEPREGHPVVSQQPALGTIAALAQALMAAHARHIVHGNIKPRNIMYARDGRLLLAGTGLPRTSEYLAGRYLRRELLTGLTAEDACFIAPEVLECRDLTPATDVYGLGVLLCFLLAGQAPFEGEPRTVLDNVAEGASPADSLKALTLHPRTVDLVRTMVSRLPSCRYENAEEALGAITDVLLTVSRTAEAPRVEADFVRILPAAAPAPGARRADTTAEIEALLAQPDAESVNWAGKAVSSWSPIVEGSNVAGTEPAGYVGKTIGGYEVIRLLGHALTGDIYLSRRAGTGETAVVKIYLDDIFPSEHAVRRFLGRARLAAKLEHPNLAQCIGFGRIEEGGHVCYAIYEDTRALPLTMVLNRNGCLPELLALRTALLVARGLLCAHWHGVIHGNLKPSVVMVNPQGRVKVTQTGLVRTSEVLVARARAGTLPEGVKDSTVAFICPEIIVGAGDLSPAADVYALGLLLFQTLTGRVPFHGTPQAVLKAISEGQRPSFVSSDDVRPPVRRMIEQMTGFEPKDRLRDMDEAIRLISALLQA